VVVLGAVVDTVNVSVCAVAFGRVMAKLGPPPVQLGASVAPDGELVSEQVNVTVPAYPATPDTVTTALADDPGATPPAGVTATGVLVRLNVDSVTVTVAVPVAEP
jgi:hypothetical protein